MTVEPIVIGSYGNEYWLRKTFNCSALIGNNCAAISGAGYFLLASPRFWWVLTTMKFLVAWKIWKCNNERRKMFLSSSECRFPWDWQEGNERCWMKYSQGLKMQSMGNYQQDNESDRSASNCNSRRISDGVVGVFPRSLPNLPWQDLGITPQSPWFGTNLVFMCFFSTAGALVVIKV